MFRDEADLIERLPVQLELGAHGRIFQRKQFALDDRLTQARRQAGQPAAGDQARG
jgi:hypothetical protein